MKASIGILVAGLAGILILGGCEDPKGPAYVFGYASVNPGGSDDEIDGQLAKSSSSDYYGYCKNSGGSFSFVVGHSALGDLEDVISVDHPLYLEFRGIQGPDGAPTQGVLLGGSPKTGDEYEGTFVGATVGSEDNFNFGPEDGDCRVALFAEPLEGELIPGRNKDFEYYVRITCSGMTVRGTYTSIELMTVNLEFYFDNC